LQPHVTYEPEVFTVDLKPEDQFVILACDGLWDVVTNEQAVEIASRYRSPSQAAAALRDYAHMLGTTDNVSVIVYRLDAPMDERKASRDADDRRGAHQSASGSAPQPSPLTGLKAGTGKAGRPHKRRSSDGGTQTPKGTDDEKKGSKKGSTKEDEGEKDVEND